MKLAILTKTGISGTVTVSDELFGVPVNTVLLAQAVRVYLANQRQGTSKVKSRGEVNRTTRKVYAQKHTGNARHGSKNAPIFVGGGVAHGPKGIENWSLKLTQQTKRRALINALSAQAEQTLVGDVLAKLDGKTKTAVQILSKGVKDTEKVLVVFDVVSLEAMRSLSNLQNIMVTTAARLSTLEVAMADKIILTSQAISALEARLLKKTVKTIPVSAVVETTVKTEKTTTVVKKPAVKAASKKVTATKTVKPVEPAKLAKPAKPAAKKTVIKKKGATTAKAK